MTHPKSRILPAYMDGKFNHTPSYQNMASETHPVARKASTSELPGGSKSSPQFLRYRYKESGTDSTVAEEVIRYMQLYCPNPRGRSDKTLSGSPKKATSIQTAIRSSAGRSSAELIKAQVTTDVRESREWSGALKKESRELKLQEHECRSEPLSSNLYDGH